MSSLSEDYEEEDYDNLNYRKRKNIVTKKSNSCDDLDNLGVEKIFVVNIKFISD